MQVCAHCGKTDTTAGRWDAGLRYCSVECLHAGPSGRFAINVSRETLADDVTKVHQGRCPVCGGSGPVDIHISYWVWSVIILTFWNKSPRLSCKRCADKALFRNLWKSLLFGWWAIPFGPIVTVIQIYRNVRVLLHSSEAARPSRELIEAVGARLREEAFRAAARSFGAPLRE